MHYFSVKCIFAHLFLYTCIKPAAILCQFLPDIIYKLKDKILNFYFFKLYLYYLIGLTASGNHLNSINRRGTYLGVTFLPLYPCQAAQGKVSEILVLFIQLTQNFLLGFIDILLSFIKLLRKLSFGSLQIKKPDRALFFD